MKNNKKLLRLKNNKIIVERKWDYGESKKTCILIEYFQLTAISVQGSFLNSIIFLIMLPDLCDLFKAFCQFIIIRRNGSRSHLKYRF